MNNAKGTKGYMLTYKRFEHLEVVECLDSDSAGCLDSRNLLAGSVIFG